jgi:hypothetical protein
MITPSFSFTSNEQASPKLAIDFTTASLDPRITFARSGNTATVVNSSGYVVGINADLPRFDFNPVTFACKGLLIEEARTNNFVYSSDFSQANWTKQLSTVSLDNGVNSPANVAGVYKLIPNNGSAGHLRYSFTTANSTTYASSFFCKKAEYDWVAFGRGGPTVWFDLTNGVLGTVGAGYTGSIQAFPNGWYRCTLTYVETTGASGTWRFYPSSSNGTIATGNGTNGVYIWGSDLQVGAFQTSHIPTEATAVTRNADIATMTGTNFSSWYNAGAGGAVVRVLPSTVSGTRPLIQFDDNTSDKIISLRGNTTNPELYIKDTTDQAQIDAGTIAANISYRLAGAWGTNDCAASVNGGAPVLDGVATIPTVNQARIGSDGTNYLNGLVESIEYYAGRLLGSSIQVISSSTGYRSIIFPAIRDTIIS